MPEVYPDDATLLAMSEDAATGVEYIATGRSPYYLEFRRMLHRLLRSAERANDLRVYQDGDLTVGVRPGRCRIGDAVISFAGAEGVAVAASGQTHVWLDAAGAVQSGTAGLPTDANSYLPLARVEAGASVISVVEDLRGEAFLRVATPGSLGLTATPEEINQALDGIAPQVTAVALSLLCGGPLSDGDSFHRHSQAAFTSAGTAVFLLENDSTDAGANVGLRLSLPLLLPADTDLVVNTDNGFLQQVYQGQTFNLVGSVHAHYAHAGAMSASQSGKVMGVVPIDGVVSDVVLSARDNIVSSSGTDGVSATVKVNGVALTSTSPALRSSDGSGFRSTARGQGVAAVVKVDGTANVQRGDVLTVDLTRTASGTVTTQATDVVAMVVIAANGPA